MAHHGPTIADILASKTATAMPAEKILPQTELRNRFQAISNMMKGDTAHAAENQNASDGGAGQAADGAQNAGYSDADNDPGTMDVADDGNDPGWGGDDGGDMDI